MQKKKVLVRDDKGMFLKMFKKELFDEFQFKETCFRDNAITQSIEFNGFVYVAYSKSEIIQFLNLDKRGDNLLMCLFDKELYENMSFLKEIQNLIQLDGYKSSTQIISEMRMHFKGLSKSKYTDNSTFNSVRDRKQFHNFFKTVLLFV